MKCPTCSADHPDSTKFCSACGQPLSHPPVQIRVSRLALASMALALICLVPSIFFSILMNYIRLFPSYIESSLLFCFLVGPLLAILFGSVGLSNMSGTGGTLTGKGYAATGITVACITIVMGIILPAFSRMRQLAFLSTCGSSLSGIGKAMLIYSNDYEDELPKAGGRANSWVKVLPGGWEAVNRNDAFNIRNNKGQVTVTSSLYLLVKYADVTPRQFICTNNTDVTEFMLSSVKQPLPQNFQFSDAWDFGPYVDDANNPSSHCSYSYHWPFDEYALTMASDSSMVIAADRNPWMPPARPQEKYAWENFKPDNEYWKGITATAKMGNTQNHGLDGQNVLYVDSHIRFEQRSFCGVNNDNIYTPSESEDPTQKSTKGLRPVRFDMSPTNKPKSKLDSYLVQ